MKKDKKGNRFFRLLKFIYLKLFRIHDSPQRIALGFGLGIFLGILPGTGLIAALFLAALLRLNRASAIFGALLTNTWLSILTFFFSLKAGSFVMRLDWQEVYRDWGVFLRNFHWQDLYKLAILKTILPVIVGYIIVAFTLAFVVYLLTVIILSQIKNARNKTRANLSG
jgi:uncharacterized protein (DUF2062 family)